MSDLNKIIEDLSSLTVAEAADLSKQLEEKWGVTPMAAAAPAAAGGAAAAEEKDDFTIMLVSAGDKKINVIKEVRAATALGLKEAKDLVEGAPKEVKAGVPKKEAEEIKLFKGSDGFKDGEQRRDFIYVEDVVKVNLWFLENPNVSGIFNVGTGESQTFNDVAEAVIDWNKKGKIKYIDFPEKLKGAYQSYTQADIAKLREAGYEEEFLNVQEGVKRYLDTIESWPKNEPS